MRIKHNNKIYVIQYHSSGSMNGAWPKYFYLDAINGERAATNMASTRTQLIQNVRGLIEAINSEPEVYEVEEIEL